MATPEIGGRVPILVEVTAGEVLLVVRVRTLADAALLRRLARGHLV